MKKLSIEDTELLFKDLSQRLPCKVKCNVYGRIGVLTGLNDYGAEIDYGNGEDTTCEIQYCLPYLRPMSSMTEEEREEFNNIPMFKSYYLLKVDLPFEIGNYKVFDWLNAHHFDYRGLIEKGLAIEITKNNNPYK